jgi:diguanylate cyclase (GGDEF)-like protein/PAS domain S-box-containing protein
MASLFRKAAKLEMPLQSDDDNARGSRDVLIPLSHIRRQALHESCYFSLGALLVVGAALFGLWSSSTHSIRENYRHYLIGLAEAAATLVDPVLHDKIRRPEQRNDPDYLRAVGPLRRMRKAVPDVHYIFTVIRDGSKIRFVLDSGEPKGFDGQAVDDQAGVLEVYDGPHPALWEALGSEGHPGHAAANQEPVRDKWDTFMTGAAPLRDADGRQIGAVGVDVNASVYLGRLAAARNWALFGLIPAGMLISLLGGAFYRIRLRGLYDARAAIANAAEAERAAANLAAERQRLGAVIEGTRVGIWDWNLVTGRRKVDERVANMVGYSGADLRRLGDDVWRELVHPDDLPGARAAVQASLALRDAIFVHEFRLRHVNGNWVWVLAHGKVMEWDSSGRALRLSGIVLDVSAGKAVELSLQASESRFRSLFELSPVGIALTDLETGRFLNMNDAMVTPSGYSRDELMRMTFWDITPDDEYSEDSLQTATLARTDRFGPVERQYQRKNGTRYSVLQSGIRMVDASGRAVIWSIVQDISQRKAMERELAEAAQRDKLTGLANRAVFMKRLQRAVDRVTAGRQSMFAVFFLDFDRFKFINDTLGHSAGDELLRQIAGRLRGTLRVDDSVGSDFTANVIARFGGDEFLLLLNDLHVAADVNQVADRLLEALAPAYALSGTELRSTASMGIVTSHQGVASAEDILRNADMAMYEAKRAGRACYRVFNEAMHTRLARHVALEAQLHKAIGTPELTVCYQPIIEVTSGRAVYAEAVLRWDHPEFGPVPPAEFIPLVEESGLGVTLGQWVLTQACNALAEWRRLDHERAPRMVSVPISRAELALGSQLIERTVRILEASGLAPHCLQLEVTERQVMRNPESALAVMRELRRIGVHLAMDDFGTGTSSLRFLREYPFNIIKIDRSLIKDLTGGASVLAVTHATLSLIENLGMTSLMEGVEERSQLAILKSLGCHYAEGPLFSSPVTAERFMGSIRATSDPAPGGRARV